MFDGKMKALTFSYDDGITQDIRLIELFNKYGMKGSFNLNSELLGRPGELVCGGKQISHNKVRAEDVRHIYQGHEVAGHTLTHPRLTKLDSDTEITRQVEEDRLKLCELVGYEVVGFAYPGGGTNFDSHISALLQKTTGIRYARHTITNHSFAPQENLLEFSPTVYHHSEWDKMFELGEKFLSLRAEEPSVFYVWGHAYEFDIRDEWGRFEEFLQMMSGKSDICYCTNREALLGM